MIELMPVTRTFFRGEIANEREGGASPSTVATAIDSFLQCPEVFADSDAERLDLAIDLLRLSTGNQEEHLEDFLA